MYINREARKEVVGAAMRHLSWRRAWTWAGFGLAFLLLRGINRLGRWLDDRWWPDISQQKIERPVFIFANARSGTTMLHRLMSLDRERFASLKLYQSLFSAVCHRRLFESLARADERFLGKRLRGLVDWINKTFFTGWEGIHKMGIDQAEEDEALFVLGMNSPSVVLLIPFLDELQGSVWFDRLEAEERKAFLDFYQDTLRRHLYASGGDRTFLNKNALFALRVRSVYERFPDARFIYLVRHPYDALPSFLHMFHEKWHVHSPEIGTNSPQARALARMAVDYYTYALDCRTLIPSDQFAVVRYEDLVADPRSAVEDLYARLDLPISDAFRARLIEATRDQRAFVSEHEYDLEQFGLTRETIYAALKDVFEEFGFER